MLQFDKYVEIFLPMRVNELIRGWNWTGARCVRSFIFFHDLYLTCKRIIIDRLERIQKWKKLKIFPLVARNNFRTKRFDSKKRNLSLRTRFISYSSWRTISIRGNKTKSCCEIWGRRGSSNDRLGRLYFRRLSVPRRAHSTRKVLRNYGRRV